MSSDAEESGGELLQQFARHNRALRAYARVILSSVDSIDDVMQEASVVIWEKRGELREISEFLPWAKVIVRNISFRYRRSLVRDRHVFDDAMVERLLAEEENEDRDGDGVTREFRALSHCLEKFTDERRELLLAPYRDPGAVKEMAARSERSPNSLYKLLQRLRVKLQRCVLEQLRTTPNCRRTMKDDRLDYWIQGAMLESLGDEEEEALRKLLEGKDGVAARRQLRLAMRMDSYLEEAASMPAGPPKPRPGSRRALWWWVGSGLAAALAIGAFFLAGDSREIATVLRVEGDGSVVDGAMIGAGDTFQPEDVLIMAEGLVEIAFERSGVHLIAIAPLQLTMHSEMRIGLEEGEVKAHVPPQGVGFVIETAKREIRDLGTSFVVSAKPGGAEVFVLDGEVNVEGKMETPDRLLTRGEVAGLDGEGRLYMISRRTDGLPELPGRSLRRGVPFLRGRIFSLRETVFPAHQDREDPLGWSLAPLLASGYDGDGFLDEMQVGDPLRFSGILGAYRNFASRSGLPGITDRGKGWMSWYEGQVIPLKAGRYRFHGYADNSLLVAINGETVFDGSRYDSAFRQLTGVERANAPAWPCLNSPSGFATGPWIPLDGSAVELDILFGEVGGSLSFGLLLVEREGEEYRETEWGQPQWPLFLTEAVEGAEREAVEEVCDHMEAHLLGSFSIRDEAVWSIPE